MKTITIRLPDVEAAMLSAMIKASKEYGDAQAYFASLINKEYGKAQKSR